MLILENIGLAELQKGMGGGREEKEKRKKEKESISVSKIFVHIRQRKTIPTNVSNALVTKKTENIEVSILLNKQHSLLARSPPYNPDMHIPYIWVKITGCFEGTRKDAK